MKLIRANHALYKIKLTEKWQEGDPPLLEKCPNTEFIFSEYRKMRTKKTPYLDTFHAVHAKNIKSQEKKSLDATVKPKPYTAAHFAKKNTDGSFSTI